MGFARMGWGTRGLAQVTVSCESLPLKLSWTLSSPHSGQLRGLNTTGSGGSRISFLFIPRTKKGDTNKKDEEHCAAKGAVLWAAGLPEWARGSEHTQLTPSSSCHPCSEGGHARPPQTPHRLRDDLQECHSLFSGSGRNAETGLRLVAPISRVGMRVSLSTVQWGGRHASDRVCALDFKSPLFISEFTFHIYILVVILSTQDDTTLFILANITRF